MCLDDSHLLTVICYQSFATSHLLQVICYQSFANSHLLTVTCLWDLTAAVILDAVKGKSKYAVNVSYYFHK